MGAVSPSDPSWPSAASLVGRSARPGTRAVALLGLPTFATSVTPRSSRSTPEAVREALARFSTWSEEVADLAEEVSLVDLGDVVDPDGPGGTERTAETLSKAPSSVELTIVLGGDNAATYHALTAVAGADLAEWALVTLDAHHDLRDGVSNGSPVRQLLAGGLDPTRVAQVGIADFANSPAYARRAREAGVTVIGREAVAERGAVTCAREALAAVAGARAVYVDIDLDAADRAAVPGCPAALPGGLSPAEVRRFVRTCARDPQVAVLDLTEVDVERDSPDGRTVRLAALCLLEALVGVARRPQ